MSDTPKTENAPSRSAKKTQPEHAGAESATILEYLRGFYDGFVFCFTRPGALGLICLEMAFWAIVTATCALLWFHAEHVLQIHGSDATRFFSRGLACLGCGLLASYLCAGRTGKISPIITYTPAYVLIACGVYGVFHFSPDWVNVAMFALGLGGGFVAGRVNDDLKALAESEMLESIFSFKVLARAVTIITTLLVFTEPDYGTGQFYEITVWLTRVLFFSPPLIFALSWAIDISIHTKNEIADIQEFPGLLQRLGYRFMRGIARVVCKLLFGAESVDAQNVPETGGIVLAANHASFLDPILLACGTDRQIQYVIYSSYYRSFAHPIFRFFRCIPVDEKDQVGALRTGVRSLKLGACIGIFPEGEVSADGKLHTAQRGALFLAQRSGAPVVSVALKGNFQAMPRGRWIPHLEKVTLIFEKPFAVDANITKKATAELTDQMMANLAQKLELEAPPKIADEVVEEKQETKAST